MLKNKIPNRFNLKTSFSIDTFNAESIHKITIEINQKVFFERELAKDEECLLNVSDYFDYREPGANTIKILWDGEHDCEHKFMKIRKVVVNQQHLAPFKVMAEPKENDYIRTLQSTDEGSSAYNKQLFNPGYRHGWYGTYKFRFMIDPSSMLDQSQQSLITASGIQHDVISTDLQKAKHLNRSST
jgi:hypothetical protein